MKSIQTVFKSTFGQVLEPQGFIYSKNMRFFFRLINGEIIQYVFLQDVYSPRKGYKDFSIFAGVRSIYADSMEKKALIFSTGDLLYFGGYDIPIEQREEIISISYNEANMEEAVNFALAKSKKIIIPKLNRVTDLDSCIELYKRYRPDMIRDADRFAEDSLILIKANNQDSLIKEFQERLTFHLEQVEIGEMGGDYDYHYESLYDGYIRTIAEPRDRVYNDPELYAKALAEIDRRAAANLEVLKSYGLPV